MRVAAVCRRLWGGGATPVLSSTHRLGSLMPAHQFPVREFHTTALMSPNSVILARTPSAAASLISRGLSSAGRRSSNEAGIRPVAILYCRLPAAFLRFAIAQTL